jgi:hypothetical protein
MLRYRVAVVFCVVQLVGFACVWLWHLLESSSGSSFLWNTWFVLLFPGDILGSGVIEKMFWHSRISPLTRDVAVVVAVVAVNALIWAVVALMIGAVRRGVRSAKVDGEALMAKSTGEIPNVGRDAKFRPTHVTTDQPTNNATQAQAKYELGEKPTHRATVPRDRVPGGLGPTPDGRPTTSGGGSQNATNQPIPVSRTEIKPLNDRWWSRFWPF